MKNYYFIFLFFVFSYSLGGNFLTDANMTHSGYTNLYGVNRISDGLVIKLPFRLLTHDFNFSYKNFSIDTKWGLEHKIKSFNSSQSLNQLAYDLISINNVDYKGELREYYLSFFPSFGEIKLGKQIYAWGAVDASSPIDILNPINYYYLFTDTDETKIGRESLAIDFYLERLKIGIIFMPNHITNNVPENDPDFPISLPASPKSYQILEQNDLDKSIEIGAYFKASSNNTDLTFSYFSGYDRNFNLYGSKVYQSYLNESITVVDTIFSYRQTDMVSLSSTSFIGDLTLRADFAYFATNDGDYNIDNRSYRGKDPIYFVEILEFPDTAWINQEFNFHGSYYQYSIQLEYMLPYNIELTSQIFGYNNDGIKSNEIDINITNFEFSSSDLFFPGMGSSMASLAKNGLLFNLNKRILDDSMEFQLSSLFDTQDKGQLNQFKWTYNAIDNLSLSLLYYKGKGNRKKYSDNADTAIDESLEYPFNAMEKFSHIRAQIQYFF